MSDAISSVDPHNEDAIIRCPRCRVRAQQTWGDVMFAVQDVRTEPFADEAAADRPMADHGGGFIYPDPSRWRIAHCSGCDQKSLWRNGTLAYPIASVAPPPHPKMDPSVRNLYEEAGQVLPLSRRAGAALVRAALEKQVRLLDDGGPKAARLDDHIARLSTRVSTPLGELLDVIRHVGNAALHGNDDDDLVVMYLSASEGEDDIAELLFDAINDLVDELVARPQKTAALWEKLPTGVKESIERKRQQAQK